MDANKKKVGIGTTLAVLSIFFVGQTCYIVYPALQSIAEQYPGIPLSTITLVSTFIYLFSVPFSFWAGSVTGTRFTYRKITMIAMLLIGVGGSAAYFTTGFTALLATRALVGIGIGIATPVGNAVIMRLYDERRAATMQGLGIAVQSVAGMAFQMIAGWMVATGSQFYWLLHLVVLVPLAIVALCFKEPPKDDAQAASGAAASSEAPSGGGQAVKAKMPVAVIIFSIGVCLSFTFMNPLVLNMSTIVTLEGIGDASLAGTIEAMFSIGGLIAGLGFGKMYQKLGNRYIIPAAMAALTISEAVGYLSSSPTVLMVAVLVSGMGIYVIWPACVMYFGEIVPDRISKASGILVAFANIGAFMASPFIAFVSAGFGSEPRVPLLVGAVALAITTVAWTAYTLRIVPRKAAEDQAV